VRRTEEGTDGLGPREMVGKTAARKAFCRTEVEISLFQQGHDFFSDEALDTRVEETCARQLARARATGQIR